MHGKIWIALILESSNGQKTLQGKSAIRESNSNGKVLQGKSVI